MTSAAKHCHALVRDGDKDRYLSTLFASDERRPFLLGLMAFNVEVSRIATAVSDPQIGLIRQQWWLDTLDGIYEGDVPAHPVAQELARAVGAGRLPKHALRDLILAREFDLYADPMPDAAALETYLGQTESALIQLAALILAGPDAGRGAAAAGLAGVAYGLARLLTRFGDRHLPPGLSRNDAAALARKRLAEARELQQAIPVAALPAFLPVALTELYLARQDGSVAPSALRRQFTLWRAARRERL